MTKIKVTQKRNNSTEITISGELTIYSVMDAYQEHFKAIKFKEQIIFKLSAINEIDTAGMQILIILFKEADKQQTPYSIDSISEVVSDYAELFNLQAYFTTTEDGTAQEKSS